ncbi:MAG: hemolysin III family protein [Chloroflexi bacterium]|nr:hemolysin III family protein [Chloroflexota bacterium]
MKFWSKWLRKTHRWLSIPMFILIPISVVLKVSGNGAVMAAIPQWEIIQSVLMLFLAISGAYLYFLPYLMKQKRKQRRPQRVSTTNK